MIRVAQGEPQFKYEIGNALQRCLLRMNKDKAARTDTGVLPGNAYYTRPRPSVSRFASLMEHVLVQNEHKGGWSECSLDFLLRRLQEEVDELNAAGTPVECIREAVDVANFCMMIAEQAQGRLDADAPSD